MRDGSTHTMPPQATPQHLIQNLASNVGNAPPHQPISHINVEVSAKMFEAISPHAEDFEKSITSHVIAGSLVASWVPVDGALNSAWRDTSLHLIVKSAWTERVGEDVVRMFRDGATNRTGRAMKSPSPEGGCYVSVVRISTCYTPILLSFFFFTFLWSCI
jgi:hypothetical protein